MQTKLYKYFRYSFTVLMLLTLGAGIFFTSCEDDEETDSGKAELLSYGPMPIARGAELKFIGNNLDKVTSIVIPDGIEIEAADFTSHTTELITLTVPQTAEEGLVVLNTSDGQITTKTPIGYSEPISITEFTPGTIKPGEVLTITGDYLNLVKEVIFTDRVVAADSTHFEEQSRKELKVTVPEEAQTGVIAVSDGAEEPVVVYSETDLEVVLPAFEEISPNPVKAGNDLTISGTDLDLVTQVKLGDNKTIDAEDFVSHAADEIVLTIPDDTQDGPVVLIPASGVEVTSEAELTMVVPTISSISPLTVKNGEQITVTGENLDLVSSVVFGGDVEGQIAEGGTATEIVVTTPETATSGEVIFNTLAGKSVTGDQVTFEDPVINSFTPAETKPNTSVTISGENLDLVEETWFGGGVQGEITAQSATELTATVQVGSETGVITLVAQNGSEVQSTSELTVLSNLPEITGFEENKGTPGEILTILGTDLDLIKEIIFPGDIKATAYGTKTDTRVEVYVPEEVPTGEASLTIITYEGEEGLTPSIFLGGPDPVLDESLVITNIDDGYADVGWGGHAEIAEDSEIAFSGQYLHGTNSALEGWAWIWGNNWAEFPSVTADDHLFKMDINISKPMGQTGVHFQMDFSGNRIDLGALGLADGQQTTEGWITVTYDLADFADLPEVINSDGEWGINLWYADGPIDITGVHIDNLRFEAK